MGEKPSLADIADQLAKAEFRKQLRFSVCQGVGWVTSDSEETIRLLCHLWNNRKEIAVALHAFIERPAAPSHGSPPGR